MPRKKPATVKPTAPKDMIPDGENVDLSQYHFSIIEMLMLYGYRSLQAHHDTPERTSAWQAVLKDMEKHQAEEKRQERRKAEPEALNTLTGQQRMCDDDYETRMMRYAWALFGHLVDYHIIKMPNFDHVQDKDVVDAAGDVHATVCDLYLALTSVFHEGNRIP
jgi:hypothetical protein